MKRSDGLTCYLHRFGYVTFANVDQAATAIAERHNEPFGGRRIVVNYMVQNRPRFEPSKNLEPSKTIFIGNLAYEMTDADLNKLFRDVRNVIDVRVAIDRRTGQPRGFAHADFVDVKSAEAAMEFLVGKSFYGRTLRLDYSSTRTKRPTSNMDADPTFTRNDNARGRRSSF